MFFNNFLETIKFDKKEFYFRLDIFLKAKNISNKINDYYINLSFQTRGHRSK